MDKLFGLKWIDNEDQTFDYCHDIVTLFDAHPNNMFKRHMLFGEIHNYQGYVIQICNYQCTDPLFDPYDVFHLDIIYNEVIDVHKCKWATESLNLLYKWVEINLDVFIKIWCVYRYNQLDENFDDEFDLLNLIKNVDL